MNMLLTVCSGLILIASAWALQRCIFHADRALKLRERVNELESEIMRVKLAGDSTLKQLQQLRGRFYAITAPPPVDFDDDLEERPALRPLAAAFCPNFGQAQLEGPLSKAAACACGYCSEMRDRRAAARSADLPRARLLTGGKANGSE